MNWVSGLNMVPSGTVTSLKNRAALQATREVVVGTAVGKVKRVAVGEAVAEDVAVAVLVGSGVDVEVALTGGGLANGATGVGVSVATRVDRLGIGVMVSVGTAAMAVYTAARVACAGGVPK